MESSQYTRQRIVLADALRGFALMGLFIVHMVEYFELYWYKPEPGLVHDVIFYLFGGKSYGIFALLFGLSFYIILDNNAQRGVDFRLRFVWRICLLLFVGYIHSLLYAGDILQLLALCGFLLVLTHNFSTIFIGIIACVFLCQIPTLAQALVHSFWPNQGYQQPLFINLSASNFEVFASGSFSDLVKHNIISGQLAKWAFFIETGRLWNIVGLMFAGVYLGRVGFFERKHTKRSLIFGIVISILALLVFQLIASILPSLLAEGLGRWSFEQVFVYIQNLCLISMGIFTFILIFNTNLGGRVLGLWAPSGRMTLTFYLLQSCIFVPMFYGFGFGWYSYIGQINSLVLGILFWVLQMFIAYAFLKHYRYGPVEKLWRVATFYRSRLV